MATSTEKTIWDYLYSKIGNAYGVAGLMANLYAESGLEPTNLENTYNKKLGLTDTEYTEQVDNGTYTNFVNDSAGYGLAQWTYYTRKQALKTLATTKSTSIGDVDTQLEYLMNELTSDYPTVLSVLKSATDYTTASNTVLTKFECPASTSSSVKTARANYAKKYYDKYASTSIAATSASIASTITINQNPSFGTHNTSVRSASISYIVIHYCGALGDAQANINYYNQTSTTAASADFFVGYSGDIWQYNPNPKSRYCWAVGGSKLSSKGGSLYGIARNANSVSIEMCVRSKGTGKENANDSNWYFEDATIDGAKKLTKYLMSQYSIPAINVIRHYDITGKCCPGVVGWNADSGDESAWQSFKASIGDTSVVTTTDSSSTGGNYYRVRKSWSDSSTQKGAFSDLSLAKKCCDLYEGYYVFDWNGNAVYPAATTDATTTSTDSFLVSIAIDDLNIRTGPGTEYSKTGKFTGTGTFTIVETSTGTGATEWGLLKAYQTDRNGWISLDYVTKLS